MASKEEKGVPCGKELKEGQVASESSREILILTQQNSRHPRWGLGECRPVHPAVSPCPGQKQMPFSSLVPSVQLSHVLRGKVLDLPGFSRPLSGSHMNFSRPGLLRRLQWGIQEDSIVKQDELEARLALDFTLS